MNFNFFKDPRKDFVAMVAHDLRTPLTVIRGTLAEIEEKGDSPELRQRLRVATDILSEHADMVIDVARLDAELYAPVTELFDVQREIARFCALATSLAQGKNLDVVNDLKNAISVKGDVTAFRHVVQNMLENAVKYTERGSVSIDAWIEDGKLVVRVTDTGIGMDATDLKQAFEPFHRGDRSAVRSQMGSGMGLWMSKRFAEVCGGTLVVESDGKDCGSRVTFALPVVV